MLKKDVINEFTTLSGIGPVTANLLYEHGFDSFIKLSSASIDKLRKIGINQNLSKSILNQLKIINKSRYKLFFKKSFLHLKGYSKNFTRINFSQIAYCLRERWYELCDFSTFFYTLNNITTKLNQLMKIRKVIYSIVSIFLLILIITFSYSLYQIPSFSPQNSSLLLTSISGGLAAIFAITFSIMMVGAQMASKFGVRANDFIFTKITYGYMFLFIISIIFPLMTLNQQDDAMIKFSILLAFICLVTLPPNFYRVKCNLNPLTILEKLENKFNCDINHLSKIRTINITGISKTLESIDSLIMLSLNEKDFNTFKQGLLYLNKMNYYLEVLKLKFKKDIYYGGEKTKKSIYYNLNDIQFEIRKTINEIEMVYKEDLHPNIFIISSLTMHTIYLVNEIKKIKLAHIERKEDAVLEIIKIIENILLKMKTSLIYNFNSNNDLLKEEILRKMRNIAIEAAKTDLDEILHELHKTFVKIFFDVNNSKNKDKTLFMNRILVELWLLGSAIDMWSVSQISHKELDSIIKIFKALDNKTSKEIFKQSHQIVDDEVPELLEAISRLEKKV